MKILDLIQKLFKFKFGFVPGFIIFWIIGAAFLICIFSTLDILIYIIYRIYTLEPIKFAINFCWSLKYLFGAIITFNVLILSLACWLAERHKDWL